MSVSLRDAQSVMNGKSNYFGSTLDAFLKANPQATPDSVDEETKRNLWRNKGKNNFFGPEEWTKYFRGRFSINEIPEIPWTKEALGNPLIHQVHFLFLGLDNLDGKPLNMLTWSGALSGQKGPRIYTGINYHYPELELNLETCGARWYLMPVDGFGRYGQSFAKQVSTLPKEYEVPNLIERVTANVLYFLINGMHLDSDFSRTSSKLHSKPDSKELSVSSLNPEGILVDEIENGMWAAIAASRKVS